LHFPSANCRLPPAFTQKTQLISKRAFHELSSCHNWLSSLPSYNLSQHPESEMSSLQESPIDSPTLFQPDLCSHNSNQSPVSQRESQEDNIEFHPNNPLVHDKSVHYLYPICGLCRIRSRSSSRALSSDRPPQCARVTFYDMPVQRQWQVVE
jgi:hypothetical protein